MDKVLRTVGIREVKTPVPQMQSHSKDSTLQAETDSLPRDLDAKELTRNTESQHQSTPQISKMGCAQTLVSNRSKWQVLPITRENISSDNTPE